MEDTKSQAISAERFGGPKEVFLHVFSIFALYVSAGALIALLFQYINWAFPSNVDFYSAERVLGAMRWSLAVLTIAFPAYIASVWYLRRLTASHPATGDMRVRRWLVYLTLFVAALIVLGDLISVLFNFLEGDITLRFLLKALSLLVVAGVVFWYYLWEMKGSTPEMFLHIFKVIAGLVVIAIALGFWVVGSPAQQRAGQLDAKRVQDLQQIQSHIVEYWRAKEELPASLSVLSDPLRGIEIPQDPETGNSYEYNVTGELSFGLCATFATDHVEQELPQKIALRNELAPPPFNQINTSWSHPMGHYCFERTIDPDFFDTNRR